MPIQIHGLYAHVYPDIYQSGSGKASLVSAIPITISMVTFLQAQELFYIESQQSGLSTEP
jgi:hypothetical protein